MTTKKPSGRPPIAAHLKKNKLNVSIPQWMIDWIDAQDEPKAHVIEKAMEEYYQICAPVHRKK